MLQVSRNQNSFICHHSTSAMGYWILSGCTSKCWKTNAHTIAINISIGCPNKYATPDDQLDNSRLGYICSWVFFSITGNLYFYHEDFGFFYREASWHNLNNQRSRLKKDMLAKQWAEDKKKNEYPIYPWSILPSLCSSRLALFVSASVRDINAFSHTKSDMLL